MLFSETDFSATFCWPSWVVASGLEMGIIHKYGAFIARPENIAETEAPLRAAWAMKEQTDHWGSSESWEQLASRVLPKPKLFGAIGQRMDDLGNVLDGTLPAPGKVSFTTAIGAP